MVSGRIMGVAGAALRYAVSRSKPQMEQDMPAGIAVTNTAHTTEDIRALARKCKNITQARRLRAVALVMEGTRSRGEIAAKAGTGRQTPVDWVHRYNAGGPDGLKDGGGGRPPKLDAEQRAEVGRWVDEGPDPETAAAWTLEPVRERIRELFDVVMSVEAVRCLLRGLGFRKLSPRPVHPKADPQAQEDFRRGFSGLASAALPEGTDPSSVDVWFQDEARVGQKGMLTRVWARKGTRPRIVRDHRYGYCCLFSAICPAAGTAAGHVCDRANTVEMSRHLLDISAATPEGRHALVVLDGAGWHRSKALEVPANVSLLRLPPDGPELNPVETVLQTLKARHFANQVFATAGAVKERVGAVWQGFAGAPARIASVGHRKWARLDRDGPPRQPALPMGVWFLEMV